MIFWVSKWTTPNPALNPIFFFINKPIFGRMKKMDYFVIEFLA
jgi:hypothetical protein